MPLANSLLAASIVALSIGASSAAENHQAVHPLTVQGPNAKMTILPAGAKGGTIPEAERRKGLVTIFSSLASKYPKGVYWCCTGYNVMGSNSGVGVQWMAGAFTPGSDQTLTEIEVGAGYSGQGQNGVVVSVNQDNAGAPGPALKTWNVPGLPVFGTCCTTVVRTDKKGIALSAGKQYWIELSTNSKESDTVDGWNVSDADQVDQATTASWDGSIWHVFPAAPGLAFAVRGTN